MTGFEIEVLTLVAICRNKDAENKNRYYKKRFLHYQLLKEMEENRHCCHNIRECIEEVK